MSSQIWPTLGSGVFSTWGLIAIFIIAFASYQIVYRLFLHPLRNVPGPVEARLTRLWELRAVRRCDFPRTNIHLHEKYGPVVRISPNRYSISTPASFKIVYGHGSKFEKSDFYKAFGNPDPELADLFSERDSQRHASKRRMVASLYSMTTLLSYERFVDNCNAQLIGKLREFSEQGRVIQVPQWMQYYAFDVIGEISVGKSFGYMQRETDPRGILAAIHDSMIYGSRMGLIPEMHQWLALFAKKMGMKIPFDSVASFIDGEIAARKSGKTVGTKDDFLDKLLGFQEKGKVDHHNLFTTIGANVAAGSDTTAIGLGTVIYSLIKNPQALTKLREEIDHFASAGYISNPVTFQEGQKMPYLQAVIKEALRIHPATGQILSRVVPEGGATLDGYFFPEGTVVGASPWVTHLNEEIYGESPQLFRPERWLEDKSRTAAMETNSASFGAGARTCIGKNISMLEMVKVIPQIFREFDFELKNPSDEWELDAGWFVKQKYECRVKLRSDI